MHGSHASPPLQPAAHGAGELRTMYELCGPGFARLIVAFPEFPNIFRGYA